MTRTKAPPPLTEHKPPLLCGCFGFTQADLERPRHEDIDAQTFARRYTEGYLITRKSNLKPQGRR